jgi:hypothetical protein
MGARGRRLGLAHEEVRVTRARLCDDVGRGTFGGSADRLIEIESAHRSVPKANE